jgi:hypothetical protein
VARPRSWSKALSAAYLRMIGLSQSDAAKSAGVGERTLARWEASPFWQGARAEARERWLRAAVDAARARVLSHLQHSVDSVETAKWLLERTDVTLRPFEPMTEEEMSRRLEQVVEVIVAFTDEFPEERRVAVRREFAARVRAISSLS